MSAGSLLIHSSIFRGISDLSVVYGSSPKAVFERFDLCFSTLEKRDYYLSIDTYHSVVAYASELLQQPNFSEILAKFQLENSLLPITLDDRSHLTVRERLSQLSTQCAHLVKGVRYKSYVAKDVAAIEIINEASGQPLPIEAQVHTLTVIDGLLNRLFARFTPTRSWVVSEETYASSAATLVEPGRTAVQFAPELLTEKAIVNNNSKGSLSKDTVVTVISSIKTQLQKGTTSLEDVAKQFNISGRQLQRHLKAHGTNFRRVLDAVRFEYARQYLSKKSTSLNAIAEKLGYSEDSAFSRSFKRWSGLAPKVWRDTKNK